MDGFSLSADGSRSSIRAGEEGIVGVITNHSLARQSDFRGMRQSLMRSFEQIYVLDLHGNAKKKERHRTARRTKTSSISNRALRSAFSEKAGLERGVWRGDLWGKR